MPTAYLKLSSRKILRPVRPWVTTAERRAAREQREREREHLALVEDAERAAAAGP
jgi:hypothetical protein